MLSGTMSIETCIRSIEDLRSCVTLAQLCALNMSSM